MEMLIVFAVLCVIYAWFGLPYFVSLSAVFAISQLIPIIGGVVTTIPIMIIALMHWGAEPIFFAFMVVHTIVYALDGNVLVPLLFAEFMDLHPVVIILSVMAFAALWGIWGPMLRFLVTFCVGSIHFLQTATGGLVNFLPPEFPSTLVWKSFEMN